MSPMCWGLEELVMALAMVNVLNDLNYLNDLNDLVRKTLRLVRFLLQKLMPPVIQGFLVNNQKYPV